MSFGDLGDTLVILGVLETGLALNDLMIFQGFHGGARLRSYTQVVVIASSRVQSTVTKHQIADLQTAASRYQTGKLAIPDCRTGDDWTT